MISCKSFFATRNDLEPGLRAIESRLSLKYIKGSSWGTPDVPVYASALDVPNLGISKCGVKNDPSDTIWVLPASAEPVIEPVPQNAGGIRYFWNSEDNPAAFIVWPGGWYEGKLLAGGMCPNKSNPPNVLENFRIFKRLLTHRFVKIPGYSNGYERPYWVGPEALRSLDAGMRLITYHNFHEDYAYLDLKRPEPAK